VRRDSLGEYRREVSGATITTRTLECSGDESIKYWPDSLLPGEILAGVRATFLPEANKIDLSLLAADFDGKSS
jgi:hypothetical protein